MSSGALCGGGAAGGGEEGGGLPVLRGDNPAGSAVVAGAVGGLGLPPEGIHEGGGVSAEPALRLSPRE